MLELGTGAQQLIALLLMLALAGLALLLFWREYRDVKLLLWVLFPVAAAFLIRWLCLDYQSIDFKICLSQWTAAFQANGVRYTFAKGVGDYNAPYLYFIALISRTTFPDLYAIKLFSILFDVLLAWGSLRLTRLLRAEGAKQNQDLAPVVAFVAALLLPTVILNGSYWGQCDVIYGALAVHAVALALEDRPRWSVALIAIAFSFKLQTIFLLPLWGVLWLAKRVKFKDLLVFPAVYAATILPALLLGKPLKDILKVYFDQIGEYPRLTLNAPSVFQFLPYGMEVNEPLLSALGITAAFALALSMLAVGWLRRGRLDGRSVLLIAVVLAIGVPFLLPRMHERYFFLADVLTLCWACADRKKGGVVCLLTAGSSLLSYLVYLRLKYNVIVNLWGSQFVMAVEACMMLTALVLAVRELLPRVFKKKLA